MTLLQIVQTFCQRTGLTSPTSVAASQDAQVKQILALVNEIAEDLVERWDWQALLLEATFTTVASQDQGAITTLAPQGFNRVVDQTIYDRTAGLEIHGPKTARAWQADQALVSAGAYSEYRIRGGRLLLTPAPAAGHLCAFEYYSDRLVLAADGVTYKNSFTADDDTTILDPKLVLAGLRWKWKSEKGLPYAEDMTRYEAMAHTQSGRDGTKPTLHMDGETASAFPGIFVSPGNWSLP